MQRLGGPGVARINPAERTENVTWFVLQAPEPISQGQADAFGRIYPRDSRPTQPLHGRDVLMSK